MSIEDFEKLWRVLGTDSHITGNGYRVLIYLLFNGEATQSEIAKNTGWHISNISKAVKRLYENNLVECKVVNQKIKYFFNSKYVLLKETEMKAENNQNWEINSQMDMTTLKQLFIRVSDDSRMSANTFAVYGDICLYGPTTRRQVWERRNWKVSGVDRSFQKLITWGLLECKQEDGKNIYFVKTS